MGTQSIREVPEQAELLSKDIEVVNSLVSMLEDRLVSVLHNISMPRVESAALIMPYVPLAGDLHCCHLRLMTIRDTLDSILSRLEL